MQSFVSGLGTGTRGTHIICSGKLFIVNHQFYTTPFQYVLRLTQVNEQTYDKGKENEPSKQEKGVITMLFKTGTVVTVTILKVTKWAINITIHDTVSVAYQGFIQLGEKKSEYMIKYARN